MKKIVNVFLISALLLFSLQVQSQNLIKKSIGKKSARFIVGAVVGYNYVVGNANGNVSSFKYVYEPYTDINYIGSPNLAMQQGAGLTVYGKGAINKKRKFYVIGALGYNLFYNRKNGTNRAKWSIFDLGGGMEYNIKTAPKNKFFLNLQLQYSLIFGGWQSDITYPDKFVSNIYVRMKPASRIGLSLGSGMEFRTSRKSYLVVGIKGSWSNLVPKGNDYSGAVYTSDINDYGSGKNVELNSSKQIIYMQIFTGVNFDIK